MPAGTLSNTLLSDDEFSDLMAAEYQASGHRLDEVQKARIWQATQRQLVAQPRMAGLKQAAGPLAMVALLLVGLLSFLGKGLNHPTTGIKGAGEPYVGQPVSLVAYEMDAAGALQTFDASDPHLGQTLVFKTIAAEGGVVALLMVEGQAAPVVRFVSSPTRGGSEQLLERGGRAYGFSLQEGQVAPLRFCVVGEASTVRLQALLSDLNALWQGLDPSACVQVSLPGGR